MDWSRTLRALLTLAVIVAMSYAAWSYLEHTNDPSPTTPNTPLLHVTILKDGDSWVASDGREYRLGMVNAPEALERCGRDATLFTSHFLADGFTAETYSKDVHGRQVAEVFNPSGDSLNVALVEAGYSDDRYLDNFRHENAGLARRLDDAFNRAATPSCRRTP
ncbi:MAG TPA: thermonuclease family protein [Aeromicrobium sp.]|nr:thermonuclease family protein [Aeromicrobium sp.]